MTLPPDHEARLIAAFFGERKNSATAGYFVEVGANEPRARSQTWHLEQAGWTGVLIEPQPDLADQLRAQRTAKVFAVACSSPANGGRMLPLHVAGPLSSLDRASMAPGAQPQAAIDVPIRTLDAVLEETGEFRFSADRRRRPRNRRAARLFHRALAPATDHAGGSRRRFVQASVSDYGRLPHRAPLREQQLVRAARRVRPHAAFRLCGKSCANTIWRCRFACCAISRAACAKGRGDRARRPLKLSALSSREKGEVPKIEILSPRGDGKASVGVVAKL